MIESLIDALVLTREDAAQIPIVSKLASGIADLDDETVDELVSRLSDFGNELQDMDADSDQRIENHRLSQAMQPIIQQLTAREAKQAKTSWSSQRIESLETLYRLTSSKNGLRNQILQWLATSISPRANCLWCDLICEDPPEQRLGIMLAFAPLLRSDVQLPESILRELLHRATQHSQIAPAVFELFNFLFRSGQTPTHPAMPRMEPLTRLLGQLTGQLGQIEEGDLPGDFDARSLNQLVSDSVALIVALCDTFALVEHEPAVGKLHQALELRHRRVQTEAAAALARLNDDVGKQALINLAEQPIARLRVLAYAEELGFQNDISLELQGEIAIAESHLAIWLSEPDQMGLAPSDIELLDNREMYWPSYEHPIQCYLFRYSYGTGGKAHSNIGICGPLTHAFAADLRHLPTDEMYAAFAGWQTVHDEIFQMSLCRGQKVFSNEVRRLEDALKTEELLDVQVQAIGSFFGQLVLVATANCKGEMGTIVVDDHDSTWFEQGNPEAPIDWQLAYAIWRGKQLLTEFNSSESY
jgi:hypothetical protein